MQRGTKGTKKQTKLTFYWLRQAAMVSENDRTSKRAKEHSSALRVRTKETKIQNKRREHWNGETAMLVCLQTIQSIWNRKAKETNTRRNGKGNVTNYSLVFFYNCLLSPAWKRLLKGIGVSEWTWFVRYLKVQPSRALVIFQSFIHTKYIFLSHNEQSTLKQSLWPSTECYFEAKISWMFQNFAQKKVQKKTLGTNSNYWWSICLGLNFHLVLFANALRMCEINNVLWFSFINSCVSYDFCGKHLYLFMYSQFRLNKETAIVWSTLANIYHMRRQFFLT